MKYYIAESGMFYVYRKDAVENAGIKKWAN